MDKMIKKYQINQPALAQMRFLGKSRVFPVGPDLNVA